MIKFEKVSYEEFERAYKDFDFPKNVVESMYDSLKLPKRATIGSAGYDFFAPFIISLKPQETIVIPTGIRAIMPTDVVLMVFPRSGLGFKFREQLDNTVGIIDSDFAYTDTQGHIMLKITNDTKTDKTMQVEKGKGFAQGIFMNYLLASDDETDGVREGGFGSTDKGGK